MPSQTRTTLAMAGMDGVGDAWTFTADTLAHSICAHDSEYGVFTPSGMGATSQLLKAYDFGFSIPAGARVDGIIVEVERRATGTVNDSRISLLKAGAAQATNKSAGAGWPIGAAYATFGGAAILWNDGGESWTPTDINNAGFGVGLVATGDAPGVGYVDHVRITVHYTEAIMSLNYTGSVKATIVGTFKNVLDLDTATDALSKIMTQTITDGTGANKAQVQWHDQRSPGAGVSENLDLTALAGGAFGSVNIAKVKALIIEVVTTTSGYRLEIGAAGGNDWAGASQFLKDASDIIRCCAGGLYVFTAPVDGWTVDGTHKVLKINNVSAGALTYNIIIIGEGALV